MLRAASLLWRTSWSCFSNGLRLQRVSISRGFSGYVRHITSTALGVYKCSQHSSYRIYQTPSLFLQNRSLFHPPAVPLSPSLLHPQQQSRNIVKVSKNKGKRKTVKAVAKRFHRTGSGKLKYWPPGKVHNMLAKSNKKSRQLRKARYATKTQLKTLNKMLAGW